MTRSFATLCLTLLLSLALVAGATAQNVAFGVATHGPLQAMVICADGHEAVVLIDQNGEPVERGAPCPEFGCADCPRLPLALTPPETASPLRPCIQAGFAATERPHSLHAIDVPLPPSRGPPGKV